MRGLPKPGSMSEDDPVPSCSAQAVVGEEMGEHDCRLVRRTSLQYHRRHVLRTPSSSVSRRHPQEDFKKEIREGAIRYHVHCTVGSGH